MREQILALISREDYQPADVAGLMHLLGVPQGKGAALRRELGELERTGAVARTKGDRYIPSRDASLVAGRLSVNRQGKGFVQPDEAGRKEIVIPPSGLSTALHGDRVLVRLDVRPRGLAKKRDGAQSGAVIRILERSRTQIVGTLQESRQFLYVVPDDPRIPHDIYVPPARDTGRPARAGDKVVVELTEWESRHTNPEGTIIEVLGAPDAEGVDMLSVLRQYRLPLSFPRAVLDEAKSFGVEIGGGDLAGRKDCRSHRVITIDPFDAKDFDDAFCLEKSAGGNWKLWVHIADVSHYVKPGSALDEEAKKRGNSTYLVDRVIPMLPEALSNELCSLKPRVDRLTQCAEFELGGDGQVLGVQFYPAVIHSKRRFTYEEAFGVLQREATDDIETMLHEANRMAQAIRRRRFRDGSLDLDFPEMKIHLDDHGRIERIVKVDNDISHQLIEEFMLLANEAVATHLLRQGKVAVHRVHEEPDEERLNEYREEVLSHEVPCGNLQNRNEVQKLLRRLGDLPIGEALKIGFLKSLKRARYAIQPLGHYGLAKKKYAHFTSPIRRYADLVIHRLLNGDAGMTRSAMEKMADHISVTERNSADAERDSRDVKLFAYLGSQLDEERPQAYEAMVTDIRNFGFFVDVTELGMSGLVHLSSFENDFFLFDSVRNHLIGRATKRVIRLGDTLKVQVCKVDTFKKQVDFRAVEEAGSSTGGRSVRPQRDLGTRGGRGARSDRGNRSVRSDRGDGGGRSERGDRGPRSGRGGQRSGGSRPRRGGRPDGQERGQRSGKPSQSQGAGKAESGGKSQQRGQSHNRGRKASSQRTERGEQRGQQRSRRAEGQQQSKRTDHRKGRRSGGRPPRSSKPRRQD